MNKLQVAEDLRGAADYIRDHGWCQHRSRDDAGRVCALGAVYEATRGEEIERYHRACEVLADQVADGDVMRWNDAPERVAQDVINGLEKVAIWLEEQA